MSHQLPKLLASPKVHVFSKLILQASDLPAHLAHVRLLALTLAINARLFLFLKALLFVVLF